MFKKYLPLITLSILGVLIRWLPNLISPVKTFGYDYGFYLFELNHWHWKGLESILSTAWPGYGNFIFALVHFLHIPSEPFLTYSQIIISVGIGLCCYYFWSNENKPAAFWSAILCFISIAQTQLYLMFLWKNLLAFIFMVLAIKFLKDNKKWHAAAAIALTLITHRTTSLILLVMICCFALYRLAESRRYKLLGLITIAFSILLLLTFPYFRNEWRWFVSNPNPVMTDGAFVNLKEYFLHSLPILILGIAGCVVLYQKNKYLVLHCLFVVSVIWVLAHLPFYNRIVPYFDIALVLYGGYFIAKFSNTKTRKICVSGLLALAMLAQVLFVFSQRPLITQTEINEIKNLPGGSPETLVIALDSKDAPWLLGYLPGYRIAAPGLFENKHTAQEWEDFWERKSQKIFFTRYSRPLIIYRRSQNPTEEVLECTPPISQNFLQYLCK